MDDVETRDTESDLVHVRFAQEHASQFPERGDDWGLPVRLADGVGDVRRPARGHVVLGVDRVLRAEGDAVEQGERLTGCVALRRSSGLLQDLLLPKGYEPVKIRMVGDRRHDSLGHLQWCRPPWISRSIEQGKPISAPLPVR